MFNMVDRPNVVIVGGGGAGVQVARLLSMELNPTKYNLILVTARPYYTHLPAWIRMSVSSEGNLEDRAHVTYNYNFVNGNGQFVIGRVVSITTEEGDKEGYLTLDTGETVDYTVLVLTPGSIWEGPLNIPDSKADTIQHLRHWRKSFEEANDIVLVGGGAVALEYAGEIRDCWPVDKRITIVQGEELLLNEAYPNSFRKSVARSIRKRDVVVILNDRVDDLEISDAGVIKTRNGRKLVADLVIPCQGPRPNTSFVTLVPESFSETGHIRVSATLQVFNYPRIFAGGDVIEWDEQKQVTKYSAHAQIIARNVISVLNKKQPPALYQGTHEMISITNGKGGSSYWSIFWGPSFGDWVSSHLKSKDLFLTWTRKNMGLQS